MPLLCTRQTQSQNSASPLVCPDTHSHSVQPKAGPYCQTAALSQSGSSIPGFQGSFHYGLPFSPGSSPGKLRAVLPPSAAVSFSCCSLENGMALLPLKRSGIGVIHRPGAIHVSLTFLLSTSPALSSQSAKFSKVGGCTWPVPCVSAFMACTVFPAQPGLEAAIVQWIMWCRSDPLRLHCVST